MYLGQPTEFPSLRARHLNLAPGRRHSVEVSASKVVIRNPHENMQSLQFDIWSKKKTRQHVNLMLVSKQVSTETSLESHLTPAQRGCRWDPCHLILSHWHQNIGITTFVSQHLCHNIGVTTLVSKHWSHNIDVTTMVSKQPVFSSDFLGSLMCLISTPATPLPAAGQVWHSNLEKIPSPW